MYSQVLLVVLLCIVGFYDYSFGTFGSTIKPLCSAREPCRRRIVLHTEDGNSEAVDTEELCSCGSIPDVCSTNWTNPEKTITLKLISNVGTMTDSMMFCAPITPPQECRIRHTALVLTGGQMMPSNIETYNCYCAPGRILVLNETVMGTDYTYRHSFICEYYMPFCSPTDFPCVSTTTESTISKCRCPGGQYCHVESSGYESAATGSCRPWTP